MRILATANPNKIYRHYENYASTHLEARLRNNKVQYFEVTDGKEKRISESLVKQLFPTGNHLSRRPFIERGNRDFYAVLHRSKEKYVERYKKIKRESISKTRL